MDLPAGIEIILLLQSLPKPGTSLMVLISQAGLPNLHMLLIPAVYWCYDPVLGMRLALISAVNGWVHDLLKQVFHLPRPFVVSSDIRILDPFSPQGFSFPSGHAQLSLTFLGMIGYRMRSNRLWTVIILILTGIGISRVWLGVHLPIDVLGEVG